MVSGSSVATAYRDKLGLPFGNGYTQAGMREDLLCSLLGKDHGGGHGQSRGGQSFCRSECLSTPGEGSFDIVFAHIKYNDDWVFVLLGDFLGVVHLGNVLWHPSNFRRESGTAEATLELVEIVECPAHGVALVCTFELPGSFGNVSIHL